MTVQSGRRAEFEVQVGDEDTAAALGSGDLAVLGTPRVVALLEQATVRAVSGDLPAERTTVGVEIAVRHRKASLPGAHITATAELAEVDGDKLAFRVAAYESGAVIADGTIRRVVVDRESFLARAENLRSEH